MQPIRHLLAALIALGGLVAVPAQAETFHTCGTIIASIPTVITSQGVYCLSHDVASAITSGNAIDIQTNNVTLDCNGYKIGGLAAGIGSLAYGVHADSSRLNITVRNCGVRGFFYGIYLQGGAGHLVEDNRLDNNLVAGIYVNGDNNRVRRNAVYDSGGSVGYSVTYGIYASADVIDNTVAGVIGDGTDIYPFGILMVGASTEARGNQVRGLVAAGTGTASGISVGAHGITVDGNRISASTATPGYGISGNGPSDTVCIGNTTLKFATPLFKCQDGGGNASN